MTEKIINLYIHYEAQTREFIYEAILPHQYLCLLVIIPLS